MDPLNDLLTKACNGDRAAREALFTFAHDELSAMLRATRRSPLDTSVLMRECFAALARTHELAEADRSHFSACAAHALRVAVVDFVRERSGSETGGAAVHIQLAGGLRASDEQLLKVNEALRSLQDVEHTLVQVVEMRFFAGMREAEVGDALGAPDRRTWERAELVVTAVMR